jgi:hypothetical protein
MTTEDSTETRRWRRLVITRLAGAVSGEAGMSTVEYTDDALTLQRDTLHRPELRRSADHARRYQPTLRAAGPA